MVADPNFSRPVGDNVVPATQEAASTDAREGEPLPESTDANPPHLETPSAGSWYDEDVEDDGE